MKKTISFLMISAILVTPVFAKEVKEDLKTRIEEKYKIISESRMNLINDIEQTSRNLDNMKSTLLAYQGALTILKSLMEEESIEDKKVTEKTK